mmetsp:Transcript_23365/g.79156  ORF Transcript_23365/g.79156 Transcript_23365/m.79156 type:complete len:232 (-) Transcript_23365:243-938(-)
MYGKAAVSMYMKTSLVKFRAVSLPSPTYTSAFLRCWPRRMKAMPRWPSETWQNTVTNNKFAQSFPNSSRPTKPAIMSNASSNSLIGSRNLKTAMIKAGKSQKPAAKPTAAAAACDPVCRPVCAGLRRARPPTQHAAAPPPSTARVTSTSRPMANIAAVAAPVAQAAAAATGRGPGMRPHIKTYDASKVPTTMPNSSGLTRRFTKAAPATTAAQHRPESMDSSLRARTAKRK